MPEVTKNYLRLPVRIHSHFSKFRTVPPSHTNRKDLEWAKKKYGIKRLPRGSKVLVGKLKKKYKKEAPRGKRVARYEWAIVTLLLPKNSKVAKKVMRKMNK